MKRAVLISISVAMCLTTLTLERGPALASAALLVEAKVKAYFPRPTPAIPLVQPSIPNHAIFGLEPRDVTPSALAQRVPVLEYHYSTYHASDGVMMTTEWFEAQMHWLSDNGFTGLTSAQFADFVEGVAQPPARSALLTFDVGASRFGDFAGVVIPALRRYGLHAVFFVQASQTREMCDGQLACWPTLLQWRDEGLISIESHSHFHQDYNTLTPEQIAYNVQRAKAIIEAHTGQPVLGMCYPYDSVNPAAFAALKAAGYRFAVAGPTRPERSATFGDPDPFALPRYYSYSGTATYPAMIGMHGQTFEAMMLDAVQDEK